MLAPAIGQRHLGQWFCKRCGCADVCTHLAGCSWPLKYPYVITWLTMIEINVNADLRALTRSLTDLALKQVPFAKAKALNSVADRVKKAEQDNIRATFKKPTPFTQNSLGVAKATKSNATAKVFVRDIASRYLLPYEEGGVHKLNGRALLNPKGVRLNSYGQLSRAMLAKLKARSDVFIGPVKTKHGIVNGVWQRAKRGERRAGLVGTKGKRSKIGGSYTGLKLLIRFGDALPVNKRLNYAVHAKQIIDQYLAADFGAALAEAMRTAR